MASHIAATAGLFGVGLYMAFFTAPPDYQQGETVRIMFIHVPAAWMALLVYTVMALASAIGLLSGAPARYSPSIVVGNQVARCSSSVNARQTFSGGCASNRSMIS